MALVSAVERLPETAASPSEVPIVNEANGVYLQLGAFGSKDNAENFLARLMLQVDWLAARLDVVARDGLHRVRAGPYASAPEARRAADRIVDYLKARQQRDGQFLGDAISGAADQPFELRLNTTCNAVVGLAHYRHATEVFE